MIILRSPKGWGGPKRIGNIQMVGSWRAHQGPYSLFLPLESART